MVSEFELCQSYIEAHPDAAARAIERLPAAQATALLQALPSAAAARVLTATMPSVAAECLAGLAADTAGAAIAGMRVDRAAVLLRHLGERERTAIADRLPQEQARLLAAMLRYPDGTAGALMDPRVLAGSDGLTVREAIRVLRRSPHYPHEYLYVVDHEQRLTGVVSLAAVTLARPADSLARIMSHPVSRLRAQAGRAAILAHPGWSQFHALPVVDEASVLVGVIPYGTFRALEEEALRRTQRLDAVATVFALGELYWLSLSGVLDGLASAVRGTSWRADRRREDAHGPF